MLLVLIADVHWTSQAFSQEHSFYDGIVLLHVWGSKMKLTLNRAGVYCSSAWLVAGC